MKIELKNPVLIDKVGINPNTTEGVREECSFGGKCNSENVVYKATIFTIEKKQKGHKNILGNFYWKLEVEAL